MENSYGMLDPRLYPTSAAAAAAAAAAARHHQMVPPGWPPPGPPAAPAHGMPPPAHGSGASALGAPPSAAARSSTPSYYPQPGAARPGPPTDPNPPDPLLHSHPLFAAAEAHRMYEVQRALESSRRAAAAQQAAGAQRTVATPMQSCPSPPAPREALFSHGLSPLDRGGLYPSHGGIMDPLSTPSSSSSSSSGGGSSRAAAKMYPGASSSLIPPAPATPTTTASASAVSVKGPTDSFLESPIFKSLASSAADAMRVPKQEPASSQSAFYRPFGSSPHPSVISSSSIGSAATKTTTARSTLHHQGGSSSQKVAQASSANANNLVQNELENGDASDNEVVVDDFDGQCCRTFAFNHKTVQIWHTKKLQRRSSSQKDKISSNRGSSSSSVSCSEPEKEKRRIKSERCEEPAPARPAPPAPPPPPPSASAGPAPQGHRGPGPLMMAPYPLPRECKQEAGHAQPTNVPTPHPRPNSTSNSVRESSLEKFAHWPTAQTPGPWNPMTPGPRGLAPPPLGYPHHPAGSMMNTPPGGWPPGIPPMGPIPMGYQLAKDPLTGQILLIPTEGAPPSGPSSSSSLPYGHPHGAYAQAHYHQLYMQQMQQYYHHQAVAARDLARHHPQMPSPLGPPPHSSGAVTSKHIEPETITVSSSDDDEDHTTATAAALPPQKHQAVPAVPTGVDPPFKAPPPKTSSKTVPEEPHSLPEATSTTTEPAQIKTEPEQNHTAVEMQEGMKWNGEVQPVNTRAVKSEPEEPEETTALAPDTNDPVPENNLTATLENQQLASDLDVCVDALLQLQEEEVVFAAMKSVDDYSNGLYTLVDAIDLLARLNPTPFDLLYSSVRNDIMTYGIYWQDLDTSKLSVELLCNVTEQEYVEQLNWVDPMVALKQEWSLHTYKSQKAKEQSRRFIDAKIKQHGKEANEAGSQADQYQGIKSLAEQIKKIKNMEIMSQLEVDIRAELLQIQATYKEKQRLLSRLRTTPKKKSKHGNNGLGRKRGPGRPKKRKLFSKKMGRPRKSTDLLPQIKEEPEDEEDLAPPVLEKETPSPLPDSSPVADMAPISATSGVSPSSAMQFASSFTSKANASSSAALLKPPKLTASNMTTGSGSVTNLSTISAKFMKGKANPFANLMKLASTPSTTVSRPTSNDEEDSEEEEEEADDDHDEEVGNDDEGEGEAEGEGEGEEVDAVKKRRLESTSDESVTSDDTAVGVSTPTVPNADDYDLNSERSKVAAASSKKRKLEKPRKHLGSTSETIVPKKPKNLFMMNCMNLQRGFKTTSAAAAAEAAAKSKNGSNGPGDEYDFHEDEDDLLPTAPKPMRNSTPSASSTITTTTTTTSSSSTSSPNTSSLFGANSTLFSTVGVTKKSNSHAVVTSTTPPKIPVTNATWTTAKPKSPAAPPKTVSATNTTPTTPKKSTKCAPTAKTIQTAASTPAVASCQKATIELANRAKLTPEELKSKNGVHCYFLSEGRFWPASVTETIAPGVYSVILTTLRNKEEIVAEEDLLKWAIREVQPEKKRYIPVGTRVATLWSSAYSCLFPGTVDEDSDESANDDNMIEVVLDDGDGRTVDLKSVRMLPWGYSHVDYDPNQLETVIARKRRQSSDSIDSGHTDLGHRGFRGSMSSPSPPKRRSKISPMALSPTPPKMLNSPDSGNKKRRASKATPAKGTKPKMSTDLSSPEEANNLRIKLDGSFNNTTTYSIRSPMYHARSEENSAHDGDVEEDSSDEDEITSNDESSDEEESSAKKTPRRLSKSTGVNPVTGRPLWKWADGDDGYRRPGSKGKAKKIFHKTIQRGSERISVGDCAVFLSEGKVDRPYIGRVESLWETGNGGMRLRVKWFYHPEEVSAGKKFDLKASGGVFNSPHTDENDVQTISHKCKVLPYKEFNRVVSSQNISSSEKRKKGGNSSVPEDTYFLAGAYDPTAPSVTFMSGVLK